MKDRGKRGQRIAAVRLNQSFMQSPGLAKTGYADAEGEEELQRSESLKCQLTNNK